MSNGNLPTNPVRVNTVSHIGRVKYNGALIVGTIHSIYNRLYYPAGSERQSTSYEALVYPTGETLIWVAHQGGNTVPNNAIEGGYTSGEH